TLDGPARAHARAIACLHHHPPIPGRDLEPVEAPAHPHRTVAGGGAEAPVQVVGIDRAIAGAQAQIAAQRLGTDVAIPALDVDTARDVFDLDVAVMGPDLEIAFARHGDLDLDVVALVEGEGQPPAPVRLARLDLDPAAGLPGIHLN